MDTEVKIALIVCVVIGLVFGWMLTMAVYNDDGKAFKDCFANKTCRTDGEPLYCYEKAMRCLPVPE